MKAVLQRSEWFDLDFEIQYRWYVKHTGPAVAKRYLTAVEDTLRRLAEEPRLGRPRSFRHPELAGLRSFRTQPPFGMHLVFYRVGAREIFAERLLHGARNLPSRLQETPAAD